ncbi:PREDICTED: microtubule-associated protein futsch-like isoform X1 [Branchiostoma belcheri]|uniref:Microtubule-associated protein futsch-like isoform X1 n=1 Tax=Branchiostoma belcheri TaxID=7741 RepID=A0A6P4YJ06_BRABE|nr:PREDICTED: microtubule-associated protein futsch-like isoform X1 [Branchiostoma belcheri]
MKTEYIQALSRQRPALVNEMDPLPIISTMVDKGLLKQRMADYMLPEDVRRQLNERMINALPPQGEPAYDILRDTLKSSGQGFLADSIDKTEKKMKGTTEEAVTVNRNLLMQNMQPLPLYRTLVDSGMIKDAEVEELLAQEKKKKLNEKLLNYLTTRSNEGHEAFLGILRECGQGSQADGLDQAASSAEKNTEPASNISSFTKPQAEKRPTSQPTKSPAPANVREDTTSSKMDTTTTLAKREAQTKDKSPLTQTEQRASGPASPETKRARLDEKPQTTQDTRRSVSPDKYNIKDIKPGTRIRWRETPKSALEKWTQGLTTSPSEPASKTAMREEQPSKDEPGKDQESHVHDSRTSPSKAPDKVEPSSLKPHDRISSSPKTSKDEPSREKESRFQESRTGTDRVPKVEPSSLKPQERVSSSPGTPSLTTDRNVPERDPPPYSPTYSKPSSTAAADEREVPPLSDVDARLDRLFSKLDNLESSLKKKPESSPQTSTSPLDRSTTKVEDKIHPSHSSPSQDNRVKDSPIRSSTPASSRLGTSPREDRPTDNRSNSKPDDSFRSYTSSTTETPSRSLPDESFTPSRTLPDESFTPSRTLTDESFSPSRTLPDESFDSYSSPPNTYDNRQPRDSRSPLSPTTGTPSEKRQDVSSTRSPDRSSSSLYSKPYSPRTAGDDSPKTVGDSFRHTPTGYSSAKPEESLSREAPKTADTRPGKPEDSQRPSSSPERDTVTQPFLSPKDEKRFIEKNMDQAAEKLEAKLGEVAPTFKSSYSTTISPAKTNTPEKPAVRSSTPKGPYEKVRIEKKDDKPIFKPWNKGPAEETKAAEEDSSSPTYDRPRRQEASDEDMYSSPTKPRAAEETRSSPGVHFSDDRPRRQEAPDEDMYSSPTKPRAAEETRSSPGVHFGDDRSRRQEAPVGDMYSSPTKPRAAEETKSSPSVHFSDPLISEPIYDVPRDWGHADVQEDAAQDSAAPELPPRSSPSPTKKTSSFTDLFKKKDKQAEKSQPDKAEKGDNEDDKKRKWVANFVEAIRTKKKDDKTGTKGALSDSEEETDKERADVDEGKKEKKGGWMRDVVDRLKQSKSDDELDTVPEVTSDEERAARKDEQPKVADKVKEGAKKAATRTKETADKAVEATKEGANRAAHAASESWKQLIAGVKGRDEKKSPDEEKGHKAGVTKASEKKTEYHDDALPDTVVVTEDEAGNVTIESDDFSDSLDIDTDVEPKQKEKSGWKLPDWNLRSPKLGRKKEPGYDAEMESPVEDEPIKEKDGDKKGWKLPNIPDIHLKSPDWKFGREKSPGSASEDETPDKGKEDEKRRGRKGWKEFFSTPDIRSPDWMKRDRSPHRDTQPANEQSPKEESEKKGWKLPDWSFGRDKSPGRSSASASQENIMEPEEKKEKRISKPADKEVPAKKEENEENQKKWKMPEVHAPGIKLPDWKMGGNKSQEKVEDTESTETAKEKKESKEEKDKKWKMPDFHAPDIKLPDWKMGRTKSQEKVEDTESSDTEKEKKEPEEGKDKKWKMPEFNKPDIKLPDWKIGRTKSQEKVEDTESSDTEKEKKEPEEGKDRKWKMPEFNKPDIKLPDWKIGRSKSQEKVEDTEPSDTEKEKKEPEEGKDKKWKMPEFNAPDIKLPDWKIGRTKSQEKVEDTESSDTEKEKKEPEEGTDRKWKMPEFNKPDIKLPDWKIGRTKSQEKVEDTESSDTEKEKNEPEEGKDKKWKMPEFNAPGIKLPDWKIRRDKGQERVEDTESLDTEKEKKEPEEEKDKKWKMPEFQAPDIKLPSWSTKRNKSQENVEEAKSSEDLNKPDDEKELSEESETKKWKFPEFHAPNIKAPDWKMPRRKNEETKQGDESSEDTKKPEDTKDSKKWKIPEIHMPDMNFRRDKSPDREHPTEINGVEEEEDKEKKKWKVPEFHAPNLNFKGPDWGRRKEKSSEETSEAEMTNGEPEVVEPKKKKKQTKTWSVPDISSKFRSKDDKQRSSDEPKEKRKWNLPAMRAPSLNLRSPGTKPSDEDWPMLARSRRGRDVDDVEKAIYIDRKPRSREFEDVTLRSADDMNANPEDADDEASRAAELPQPVADDIKIAAQRLQSTERLLKMLQNMSDKAINHAVKCEPLEDKGQRDLADSMSDLRPEELTRKDNLQLLDKMSEELMYLYKHKDVPTSPVPWCMGFSVTMRDVYTTLMLHAISMKASLSDLDKILKLYREELEKAIEEEKAEEKKLRKKKKKPSSKSKCNLIKVKSIHDSLPLFKGFDN